MHLVLGSRGDMDPFVFAETSLGDIEKPWGSCLQSWTRDPGLVGSKGNLNFPNRVEQATIKIVLGDITESRFMNQIVLLCTRFFFPFLCDPAISQEGIPNAGIRKAATWDSTPLSLG